jgi:hypothetical protein
MLDGISPICIKLPFSFFMYNNTTYLFPQVKIAELIKLIIHG